MYIESCYIKKKYLFPFFRDRALLLLKKGEMHKWHRTNNKWQRTVTVINNLISKLAEHNFYKFIT